jgi:hypothetical protein
LSGPLVAVCLPKGRPWWPLHCKGDCRRDPPRRSRYVIGGGALIRSRRSREVGSASGRGRLKPAREKACLAYRLRMTFPHQCVCVSVRAMLHLDAVAQSRSRSGLCQLNYVYLIFRPQRLGDGRLRYRLFSTKRDRIRMGRSAKGWDISEPDSSAAIHGSFNNARRYYQAGCLTEAERLFRQVLRLDPLPCHQVAPVCADPLLDRPPQESH